MNEIFASSALLGTVLSLLCYYIGAKIKTRAKTAIANPLLISVILVIVFLSLFRIDYASYQASAKYISWFLTPATVALAVPLYEQLERLRRNLAAVVIGVGMGTFSGILTIFLLSKLFGLEKAEFVTLLPKSVTTAIGIAVSEELGGYPSLTAVAIVITGILGNVCAEGACRVFRITEPVAKGLAIGTASHAIGTSKAMEIGKTEGAMSSLALVLSGIITVAGASIITNIY